MGPQVASLKWSRDGLFPKTEKEVTAVEGLPLDSARSFVRSTLPARCLPENRPLSAMLQASFLSAWGPRHSGQSYIRSVCRGSSSMVPRRGLAALVLAVEDMRSAAGGELASWQQTAEVTTSSRRPNGLLSSLGLDVPSLKLDPWSAHAGTQVHMRQAFGYWL